MRTDVFAKAPAKKSQGEAKEKGSLWTIPRDKAHRLLSETLAGLAKLVQAAKKADAKKNEARQTIHNYAERRYLTEFAKTGTEPPAPIKLFDPDSGATCLFVAQDRSQSAGLKGEQVEALNELLGPEEAAKIIEESRVYSFDTSVLAEPGVRQAVHRALSDLVREGKLAKDQLERLITSALIVHLKPGTLARMAEICGRDSEKMAAFLDAVGSSSTRFVKAE